MDPRPYMSRFTEMDVAHSPHYHEDQGQFPSVDDGGTHSNSGRHSEMSALSADQPPSYMSPADARQPGAHVHDRERSFPTPKGPSFTPVDTVPPLYDSFNSTRNSSSTDDIIKDPDTAYRGAGYGGGPPIGGHPRRAPGLPAWLSWWYWNRKWNMFVCLAVGVSFAVAHHTYYNHLNGQPANDQIGKLRYGQVMAFLAKAALCASVTQAFQQRVWTTVRTRLMPVHAVDSLFAATEEIVSLFNYDMLRHAKRAVLLATFVWVAPLTIILTVNTLTVEPRMREEVTTCLSIRTLNFTLEGLTDWRNPVDVEGDGSFEQQMSLYNTTKQNDSDTDWFDYYTAPSAYLTRIATLAAYLQEVAGRKNVSVETCGDGWNCTASINFTAPGYKCTTVASGLGAKLVNLTQESGSAAPPFDLSSIVPSGNLSYLVAATLGDYSITQMKNVTSGGVPVGGPPYPKHLGAFRVEPIIWMGYADINDRTAALPLNSSDPLWETAFTPKIVGCEHYLTNYEVAFNWTGGVQVTTVKNRTFLTPIINTTYTGNNGQDGTADNVTATPTSNYVYPSDDVIRYRTVAGYHSLGLVLRSLINGTIAINLSTKQNPFENTNAVQTKLLDPRRNYFPYPNLPDLVQSVYEDIILSMFSNPLFSPVAWASEPSQRTGDSTLASDSSSGVETNGLSEEDQGTTSTSAVARRAATTSTAGDPQAHPYACTRTRTRNVFSYNARVLWLVYSIAVVLALAANAVGAWAIHQDGGGVRNTHFSSIVAATRGPALDKVRWVAPDGRAVVPIEVMRMRVGYGAVDSSLRGTGDGMLTVVGGDQSCLFGIEGDVRQLRGEGGGPTASGGVFSTEA